MNKSFVGVHDGNFTMGMSFSKVDIENRLVSGFATLDNLDSQDDIVLASASLGAFERARMNVREMHQPIAAGKIVDFREEEYFDSKSGNTYKGMMVTVYVSKGAESTWQKVLDGTLSGFSIMGPINEKENMVMNGKMVSIIKDYDLVELSLVDNPANPLANVTHILKFEHTADGLVIKGLATEVNAENVFYCEEGDCSTGIAKTSKEEALECLNGHNMTNIGWIEYTDTPDKAEKVMSTVSDYVRKQDERRVTMADEVEKAATAEVVEAEVTEEEVVAEVEEEVTAEVEKAADEEVKDTRSEFTKAIDDLRSVIETGLEKNRTDAKEDILKASEDWNNKIDELIKAQDAKHDELVTKFESLKSDVDKVEKTLDGVVSETAVKKSGDLGGSPEKESMTKNSGLWAGSIFSK